MHDLTLLPASNPLLKLLRPDDNPHYHVPQVRLPSCVHPGNDGSTKPTITLAKARVRSYHTTCSTFLDLVDDPLAGDWQQTQRLRLRAGSRKCRPTLRYPVNHSKAGQTCTPSEDLSIALEELYINQPIQLWPPAKADSKWDEIYKLLNPPSHLGNVDGTMDDRSLVYSTGPVGQPQAIVFVGFDPAMRLVGLKTWDARPEAIGNFANEDADDMDADKDIDGIKQGTGEEGGKRWGGTNPGMYTKGVGEGPHIDGRATGRCGKVLDKGKGNYIDAEESDRTVVLGWKGKRKELGQSMSGGEAVVEVLSQPGRGKKRWAWKARAMYLDIGMGYHFGKEKRDKGE